jgi:hypothetical protein
VGRRNPIHVVGEPIRHGFALLTDELIREGAHDDALGSDGLVVLAFLVSCGRSTGSNRRPWETSPAALSAQFGWGLNRVRAMRAIERAEKDHRLVRRKYLRDGKEMPNRCTYVVCCGGRRFTDEELSLWSRPIEC